MDNPQESHKRMSLEDRLSPKEAADLLRVSRPTLNKFRREKLITGIYISPRKIVYSRRELLHFLRTRIEESGMLLEDCDR